MSDPLFDTLFRPTALPARAVSAAPVRAAGTRSRAGNAMNRTRAALLDGARRAVEVSGTKITMAQVAAAAGVAKATLYNHFRTRDAVLAALVEDEVRSLIAEFAERPLPDALTGVAGALARNPLLRTLAQLEPATLARVAAVDAGAPGWRMVGEGLTAALGRAGRGGETLVLRWLSSLLITPAGVAEAAGDVAMLMAGLPEASVKVPPAGAALPAFGPDAQSA